MQWFIFGFITEGFWKTTARKGDSLKATSALALQAGLLCGRGVQRSDCLSGGGVRYKKAK
jgi:hypothetical protein